MEMCFQVAFEKVFLHDEAGAQQSGFVQPHPTDFRPSGSTDVQQGDLDRTRHLSGAFMGGVAAEQKEVGPALFQTSGCMPELFSHDLPVARAHGLLHRAEIQAVHQYLRRVQTTQALFGELIEQTVILQSGFPARSPDQTDCFHMLVCNLRSDHCGWRKTCKIITARIS